jgi:hypothetical protein
MFKRLILGLLLLATIGCELPVILLNSSHTHNSFQLSLSIAPGTVLELYSKKIVRSSDHWAQISTLSSPATVTPPFPAGLLLVNTEVDGRHLLEYYEKTVSNDLNRHFHYMAVRHEGSTYGYLLPSYSQRVPAFRTDRIYRCSNSILSVEWIEDAAHVVVFSQEDRWHIAESIDGGFRSDERGLYYGYAIDEGHSHPVKLQVGHRKYCLVDRNTPTANIDFKWEVRENYELNDILYIAGESLPVHDSTKRTEEL